MDLSGRLRRMEKRLGRNTEGCPACAGRTVTGWWYQLPEGWLTGDQRQPAKPRPILCGRCGRDIQKIRIIQMVEDPNWTVDG